MPGACRGVRPCPAHRVAGSWMGLVLIVLLHPTSAVTTRWLRSRELAPTNETLTVVVATGNGTAARHAELNNGYSAALASGPMLMPLRRAILKALLPARDSLEPVDPTELVGTVSLLAIGFGGAVWAICALMATSSPPVAGVEHLKSLAHARPPAIMDV